MCGVFGLSKRSLDDKYLSRWNPQKYIFEWIDRYAIRPTQASPVIIQTDKGNELKLMRFGLIPSWAKTEKLDFPTINAKAETVEKLPTYRGSFKEKRCLVLADHFYEFKPLGDIKQPFVFKAKQQGPMYLAGLYDINTEASNTKIESFSIITTEANNTVAEVHPRMPVIFNEEEAEEWLNVDNNGATEKLKSLLKAYPDVLMESWMVERLVNQRGSEGPELISPIK